MIAPCFFVVFFFFFLFFFCFLFFVFICFTVCSVIVDLCGSWGKRKCAAMLCLRFVTCVLSVPVCLLFLLVSLLDHGSEPRLLRSLCLDMNCQK